MTAAAPAWPALEYRRLPIPAAAFEVLAYLAVVAAASLAFVTGWMSVNAAIVLTVILLASLMVLSWIHLGQGRHPVFLFLCTLMLFQGGRLVAYCLGAEPEPMRVIAMDSDFVLTRNEQGIVLLCLALSAICIYAPCRWFYRPVKWECGERSGRFLPYLYLVFFLSLPMVLFKGYQYYQYAMAHGGYLFLYINHEALAATVPFWVRILAVVAAIVLVGVVVVERRPRFEILAVLLYFGCSLPSLLLGSRMPTFSLALALFYVFRVKSETRFRVRSLIVFVLALMLVAGFFGTIRSEYEKENGFILPMEFVRQQGISLNVTEVAVRNPEVFRRYQFSYLSNEIQAAFVGSGAYNYARGRMWDADVSTFLDAGLYRTGLGVGGSYIAEAYAYWGLIGVMIASIGIGMGLTYLAKHSNTAIGLFVVAITLPDIFLMPRGSLFGWASLLARSGIVVALLALGWQLYRLLTCFRHQPVTSTEMS